MSKITFYSENKEEYSMKKIKKALAILLSAVMSATMLGSCGSMEEMMGKLGDFASSVYDGIGDIIDLPNENPEEVENSSSIGGENPDKNPEENPNENPNDNPNENQSAQGTRTLDFTKAKNVKDVTDLYYYIDGCPTVGDLNVLVIPVEFSDVTASRKGYTIDKIEKAFNGTTGDTGYYSVHDYYYQSSGGKLDIEFTVASSWFKPASRSSSYKRKYDSEGYFIGDQMIMDEALASLSKTMDLSEFDSDDNAIIDAVILVPTLDVSEDIQEDSDMLHWAYRYWNYYVDDDGYYYEYDGVSANDYMWAPYQFLYEDDYGFNNKNAMNTYTFIHEFGHILGAEDYYDTSYTLSGDEMPLGGYDMMDAMTGDHNPFTKFHYGWLTTSRLVTAETSVTLTLEDFTKNGDTIIIANNWDDDLGVYQEYYIVMYYTNNGLNAGEGFGFFEEEGILVYHVNAVLYKETDQGQACYDFANTNTDPSDEDYGTEDNLIEYIKLSQTSYVYGVGDSLAAETKTDTGAKIAYTFTVDSLTDSTATLTFTKNK